MTEQMDTIGDSGLQFYSKISASISHDIKNALAIINENAGLMDDFTMMANQGMPIEPERLKTLASMITKQVGRANDIVTNLSRFAHSLDEPVARVDLNETIKLLIGLTGRLFEMRKTTMAIGESSHTVTVETSPFYLMTLLWYLLDTATADDRVTSIAVAAENREDGARIVLQLEGNTHTPLEMQASQPIERFLNLLNAEVTTASGTEEVSLNLPARIDALNL